MSKKFGKFLLFSAVAGTAAYGAYQYLQKKDKATVLSGKEEEDDLDDISEDLDEDAAPAKERSYVSLNLDKAEAFAAEAFQKAREVITDSVQKVKETVMESAEKAEVKPVEAAEEAVEKPEEPAGEEVSKEESAEAPAGDSVMINFIVAVISMLFMVAVTEVSVKFYRWAIKKYF